jgi:DNA-directed RNA polymerase specialized sigma24 family protein
VDPEKNYRGRVKVCKRWYSFIAFLKDVGPKPSPAHSLDRYPDRNGDYKPGNVRWATARQQANNRDTTVFITFKGECLSVSDWARKLGLKVSTLQKRIRKRKMPLEKALTPKLLR